MAQDFELGQNLLPCTRIICSKPQLEIGAVILFPDLRLQPFGSQLAIPVASLERFGDVMSEEQGLRGMKLLQNLRPEDASIPPR
ncbi:MAG TPA: hypothetical protein VLX28_10590, partial [Thermoanaerobaculia bacterium]|nr:hypothetical protein [Thermoanaerobaculia bacterium]